MAFIKKISDSEYLIYVHVIPNSKKQSLTLDNDSIRVTLVSPPKKNKANKELLKFLKNKVGVALNQIQLVSGNKSHEKIIRLIFNTNISMEQIINKFH